MELHPLQQLVHVEARVVVVEPHDEAERHLGRAERIEEAAAEGVGRERPAQGVDDRVQRPLHLPDLLDAEREELRVGRAHLLPLAPGLAQRAAGALGDDRDRAVMSVGSA